MLESRYFRFKLKSTCQSDLDPARLYEIYLAFLDEAHRLKKLYANEITLLVGIETDFISERDYQELESLLKEQAPRIQYLVGSIHHVKGIPIDFDRAHFDKALAACSSTVSTPQTYLKRYFDEQYAFITRFKPQVIGHFDLCRLFVPTIPFQGDQEVWDRIVRNVEYVIDYGGLFEANAASFRKGWSDGYPGLDVLKVSRDIAAQYHLTYVAD